MAKPTESNTVIWSAEVRPADSLRKHLPQFGDRELGLHLLDLALDTGLRRVLDEHGAVAQDRGIQLRLAGAVAADRVDVHAGCDIGAGEHGGVRLVGGAGGDDVGAVRGIRGTPRPHDVEAERGEVALELVEGRGVGVEHAEPSDAEHRAEGECLELGLGSGADHGHHLATPDGRERGRRARRSRRCAAR